MKIKYLTYPHGKKSCNKYCPDRTADTSCFCTKFLTDFELALFWYGFLRVQKEEPEGLIISDFISMIEEYNNSSIGESYTDLMWALSMFGEDPMVERSDPNKSYWDNIESIVKGGVHEMKEFIGEYYKAKRKRAETSGSKGLTEECDK